MESFNTSNLGPSLADANSSIRWLASSSLVKFGGMETLTMMGAFLKQEPVEGGREEARRVLGLIADTAEDEAANEQGKY